MGAWALAMRGRPRTAEANYSHDATSLAPRPSFASVRAAAEAGTALFGTIDTWLVWNLTGGVNGGLHITGTCRPRVQLVRDSQLELLTHAWPVLLAQT